MILGFPQNRIHVDLQLRLVKQILPLFLFLVGFASGIDGFVPILEFGFLETVGAFPAFFGRSGCHQNIQAQGFVKLPHFRQPRLLGRESPCPSFLNKFSVARQRLCCLHDPCSTISVRCLERVQLPDGILTWRPARCRSYCRFRPLATRLWPTTIPDSRLHGNDGRCGQSVVSLTTTARSRLYNHIEVFGEGSGETLFSKRVSPDSFSSLCLSPPGFR